VLASEAITAAYREGNLLGINATATDAQLAEGLSLLNSLLLAAIGYEAGEELGDLNIGGQFDQSGWAIEFIPENARLVLDLAGAVTYSLHPLPYDGQRVAIADATSCLAANNLTLDGNGHLIEGAATLVLNTNGDNRQWFYRADLGQWKRLTSLALTDELPFPTEFDDYFRILLAMRLNPRYGQELQQGSALWLNGISTQLEARYRKPRRQQDWGSLGLLGQRRGALQAPSAVFARGWPL
jgi:hypothetical protein